MLHLVNSLKRNNKANVDETNNYIQNIMQKLTNSQTYLEVLTSISQT